MLAAFKLNVDALIRLIIVASGAWLSLYVFRVLMRFVAPAPLADVVAIPFAIALGVALYVHPGGTSSTSLGPLWAPRRRACSASASASSRH